MSPPTSFPKMPKGYSANWVFTINNPTVGDYDTLTDLEDDDRVLSCKAESEIGKKGTPHFQGAIQFKNDVSKKVACRRLGGRAWTQKAFGTWEDQDYCLKDPVPIKVGDEDDITLTVNFGTGWVGQGNRTELEEFRDAILTEGVDDDTLLTHHLREVAKYPRLEARLKFHRLKKLSFEFRKVKLWVYFGTGGTGKDRRALYGVDDKRKPDTFMVGDSPNLKWWDGYDGESTIVISDFYGERSCKFDRFLRLMDGHQCKLEIKGGHTFAMWSKVILTSNMSPAEWYESVGKGFADREYARRFHRCTDVKNNKIYLAPGNDSMVI